MLTKMVDGVEVELTPEEEAETRAEWSANAAFAASYEAENGYKLKREAEYPKIGDQLDAIYKGFKQLEAIGIIPGADCVAWVDKLDSVKAKHPKPS